MSQSIADSKNMELDLDTAFQRYSSAMNSGDKTELSAIQAEYKFLDREMFVMEYLLDHGEEHALRLFFYRDEIPTSD
jgi:hypothetical protein